MSNANTNPSIVDMTFPEIFRKISSAVGINRKADLLKEYRNTVHGNALTILIVLIYDWSIEYRLPEGVPPYTRNENPLGTDHTRLLREANKLYRFVVGGCNLTDNKVQTMYIELLESLHETESSLLNRIFNRSFDKLWEGDRKYVIPLESVKIAFPEILFNGSRGNRKQPTKESAS
jgi:Family of unknown function (DUF6433)